MEPLDHEVVAYAADQEVACCTDRFDGMPGYGAWSGWYGTSPEHPLYVGFVASGFTEGAWLTIEVSADHGPVRAGEVVTGQDVVAVDLFEAATAQEPAVRVGARQIIGGPSDLLLSWSASHGGFVTVQWDLPDARGDVELAMPGLAPIDNLPSTGTWGELVAASGPGTVELGFTEAQRPDGSLYADPDGQAWAVFADLALPYASAHAWSAPT